MVADNVLERCPSSESKDMKLLDSNSKVENNTSGFQVVVNNIDNAIFSMEELGQVKEVNQGSHIEALSVSHFSAVDVIQSNNNSGNVSLVGRNEELGTDKIDGSKRPEDECKSKESSVCVVYSSLPSQSKRKLEELLHQWSEWHTQHFTSADDPDDGLESGEETYFPALRVGSEKPLAVSFSMDVHVRKKRQESLSLNNDCSPLYDRGYAVGLASDEGITEERVVDLREALRCFNCGSYNHPLRDCQKPRNIAAVNSARKQYLSKKNQSGGPRVQTRYYQESPGGKFDGLKPGALSAETRKLLGLGELDPPPWLNRMRELGYPLGYLDSEEEDQPSGIAIFGDEESQNVNASNGLPLDVRKSQKKMSIDFPGINGPIPKKADQKKWTAASGGQSPDYSWNQSYNRWNRAREALNNGLSDGIYGRRNHIEGPPSPYGLNNELFHGVCGARNHIEGPPSPYGLGLSPPISHYPHNYPPREAFSSRGDWNPGGPHNDDAGRPFMLHFNYGSL